ncbi:MAG: endolytic transglycosylase MltG [Chloroflexi bacterium]|nr:endolytic transglycosylase MltG [Chloroflexota bacterium]
MVVAGAGLIAYVAFEGLPGMVTGGLDRWDAPVSAEPHPQAFTVQPGQSAAAIGDALHQRGLIRSPIAFRALVEARGVGDKIEAGDYTLSPSMTTNEIITALAQGASRSGIVVTIPEGWRLEQVAQKIETLGISRSDAFLAIVRAGSGAGFQMAEPPPSDATLEGYLFPETYEIRKDATVRTLVEMMVRHFDRTVTPALREAFHRQGLTLHQAVTLASIVEREAVVPAEQPVIASVYLNRLRRDMPLQADPTVQFAVANANPSEAASFNFWKRDLSGRDLELHSPYNTYTQRGLPPGPICSPGLAALEAVANPAQTDYLYFVAKGDGSHVFAKTDIEHQANVDRYRR